MKILPKVLVISTVFAVLLSFFSVAYAQTPSLAPNLGTISPAPQPGTVPDNAWVIDKEVTFIGKNAARSGLLLDWTLRDYNWSKVQPGAQHPLIPFWITIRNIVYALFILFVIGTAFVLIVTRGRSLAAKRFVPRFIAVVLLVTFSFSMLQLLYQVTDAIQGFFLSSKAGSLCPPDCISQKDLFYWSWDYTNFEGLRLTGPTNEESAFISLLLTKISALTYFVMVGILIVRKIILWFFIIVSPIFPLLLLYYPVRNTGKIWIGEFFRWLLYAPLFSIFLAGLVSLWRLGIPMNFIFSRQTAVPGTGVPGTDIYYPTAVNILLAGPGQSALVNNSVNLTDTFALYVVALIMLWMVIILPWILLQIFLDYMNSMSFKSAPFQQMMRTVSNRFPPPPPSPAPLPAPTGLAMPFGKKFAIPAGTPAPTGLAKDIPKTTGLARAIPRQTSVVTPTSRSMREHTEVLRLANLSLPTMRDIARFETSRISSNIAQSREVASMREKLQQIANPSLVSTSSDRSRYQEIREKLIQQSNAGNIMAQSILTASSIVSSASSTTVSEVSKLQEVLRNVVNPNNVKTVVEKDRYREFHEKVIKESAKGNQFAQSILSVINNLAGSTSATQNLTRTLSQIANSESATNLAPSEKEQVTRLKETLMSEKEKGNTLAVTVLKSIEKMSQATTDQERTAISNELHDTLVKESEKGNVLATTLLQSSSESQASSVLKETLQQLANPATITNQLEHDRITALKETLVKESQNNNELATTILSATEKEVTESELQTIHDHLIQAKEKGDATATSIMSLVGEKQNAAQIEKVKEQLAAAKESGEPLAVALLSLLTQQGQQALPKDAVLPNANRIQQVSLDDYEAVKSMWVENYHDLEVPQSTSGGQVDRKAWVQDDINQISNTISLLTSQDEVKIEEGMKEVSSILPFLLIGGFSQEEIVSYLKAKLEAAKAVKTELDKTMSEEDTMLEAQTRKIEAAKTMSATAAQPITNNVTVQNMNNITVENDEESESPITNINNVSTVIPATGSTENQILTLSNLTLPTMHDIVKYEAAMISQKQDENTQKVVTLLKNVSAPEKVEKQSEREQLVKLKEVLQKESQAGNPLATSILTASGVMAAGKQMHAVALPTANRVQQVSLDDYESVRSMWTENYRSMDVPQGAAGESGDRNGWITEDMRTISNTISLLTSQDEVKIEEGMKEVSSILPFLLIGGFSQGEIVSYLKAKLEAAKTVHEELGRSQETEYVKSTAPVTQSKTIQVPIDASGGDETVSVENVPAATSDHVVSAVQVSPESQQILTLSELTLPTMHDIARYEKEMMIGKSQEAEKVMQTLQNMVNPDRVTEVSERERILKIKDTVVRESQAGNPLANSIIGASQVAARANKKINIPQKNTTQAVSIDDYESVKKMWIENYETMPVPEDPRHPGYTREEWLLKEIEDITNILALLTSGDEEKIEEGLKQVSDILPFLLIGGFSLDEIISYLKAKLEAAKFVFESLRKAKKEDDSLVEVNNKKSSEDANMQKQEVVESAEISEENKTNSAVAGE